MTEELGMDDIMAQSLDVQTGSVVDAMVLGQTDEHLLLDVGLKQEAQVPLNEFNGRVPAIGTTVPVLMIRINGPEGRPLVSWRQARERSHWDVIAKAFEAQTVVEAHIVNKIKGGYQVDIGLDAFLPASQVDVRPVTKPEEWLNKTVQVVVIELDAKKRSVVVSRRKIVEKERLAKKAEVLSQIQVGQVHKGQVTGLTNFGAFVDIGGVEGLLHVTDIAWSHIDNPQKVLKVGDQFEVKVLKFDSATHRISLGRKQLLPHPWEGLEQRYPIHSLVKGKVTGLADFGAFVEIEPGVEGLIHVSEFSWTERVKSPKGILKTGQEVEARLIGIDREKEKISLSLRRVGASPWEQAMKDYPIGSKIEGTITHMAPFGAFVKIPSGVEALLKTQDISWTEKIHKPEDKLKVGDTITAMVLEINPQEEKMALGLKQLEQDPIRTLKIGQEVTGTVMKVGDFGVIVKLKSGVEGIVRASELQLERSMFNDEKAPKTMDPSAIAYKEGESITASVVRADRRERKVELSVRRYEKNQERQLLKKYSNQDLRPTLGETTGWEG